MNESRFFVVFMYLLLPEFIVCSIPKVPLIYKFDKYSYGTLAKRTHRNAHFIQEVEGALLPNEAEFDTFFLIAKERFAELHNLDIQADNSAFVEIGLQRRCVLLRNSGNISPALFAYIIEDTPQVVSMSASKKSKNSIW
jgi:hypothetical protein